jgi:phosphoenolpyruvate---glycerone phosphotransferase subunit DhaL
MTRMKDAIDGVSNAIIAQKDFLTKLDREIGDGDHGINMARGFEAVLEKIEAMEDTNNPGLVLQTVGKALMSTVGGAAGPLYATAFLRASEACDENTSFNVASVEKLLGAAVQGIQERGKAVRGDKTILDVLIPVHEVFVEGLENEKTLFECMGLASRAAKDGIDYTKTIAAKKGRASYVGERSIGHQDPGATSAAIMVRALYDFLRR